MFTADDLRTLLRARPFVGFRLMCSDGGSVDVRSPEVVLVGRRFAVIGLLDPEARDTTFDRYTTVWYMHVTRAELMAPSAPPFSGSPPTTGPETPAPVA